ncbi:uncharacterized protein LOC122987983 [Thunnus albacares]|uniref:uncharacterized protein LOC121898061 n=1 Tax=Thunnus maccoyii TaxID=8240 RepID=UPI001C4DBDFC|nr:uncharacterized protein LOC121898061 [Thunnus maccoyii]XP_042268895.1 uncharacterized protein LOC121898061 [Thunnus maccoyii]XP_042268904.1 uncharacterized protein LOC121898061 [Thunnus maccoyii]XP_042268912.1 uncharacterized protein LOC121898061 [Thunnus maccoyii]XP_042268919.1 uncharacterized protein LOC121898061 [Thunnus maccoyii]XP_044215988.1 uncharacterized protein LOC122987983 [Thunnus albacares]XP_044215997.1 uncharacterized protein LOC122987983 [Thunnus albacares]
MALRSDCLRAVARRERVLSTPLVTEKMVSTVSLAQDGPAPCFFKNWCYQFLATGDFHALQLTSDDVDDLEYALLIEKVEAATDLTQFTEETVSCGYTELLKVDRKDSIIRAIVLHATVRLTPMLQQIRNGMKVYNLLEVIGRHQTLCTNLFVSKEDDDRPGADYIMSILAPELSESGSRRQARENSIINFFQDFLQDLEVTGEDQEMCEPLTQEVLQSQNQEGHWSLEQQEHWTRAQAPSSIR